MIFRAGMVLGLLGMFSMSASAALTLEETARQVIMGFQHKDAKLINSLIDKKTGLYVLYHRGASLDYEHLTQIDFNRPVPEYLYWPSAGDHIPRDDEFDRKTTPHFDCADKMRWDRTGYFISKYDDDHQLSGNMAWTRKYSSGKSTTSEADIAAARKLERWTVRVVAAPEKPSQGDGMVFYLSQIPDFGSNWYLTVVDQFIDCGA